MTSGQGTELELCHRLDALGAKSLADQTAIFHHFDALEIWFKLVPCRAHRVAAAVAEHGSLTAGFASSHDKPRLLCQNSGMILPYGSCGIKSIVVALNIQ